MQKFKQFENKRQDMIRLVKDLPERPSRIRTLKAGLQMLWNILMSMPLTHNYGSRGLHRIEIWATALPGADDWSDIAPEMNEEKVACVATPPGVSRIKPHFKSGGDG